MAKVNPLFSRDIDTFKKFTTAVEGSGHTLTDAEVKRAAKKFKVPVAKVQALRDAALSQSHQAADGAGKKSKDLRGQTSFGVPAGLGTVKGLSQADQLRFGVGAAAPVSQLPAAIETATLTSYWGVNLSSKEGAVATAILEDGKKNRVHLAYPYEADPPGTPKIGFLTQAELEGSPASGESVTMRAIDAAFAKELLPILDQVIANGPPDNGAASGPGYGVVVAQHVQRHCEDLLVKDGAPSREALMAKIDEAVGSFDAGQFRAGERLLSSLSNAPYSAVRAQANFLLGEMRHRMGQHQEAIDAIKLALPSLTPQGQVQARNVLATASNALRRWDEGINHAEIAVRLGENLRARGAKINLTSSYFYKGVAEKNLGRIDAAIDSMQKALIEQPTGTFIQLALAGYLAIAGKKAEAEKTFAAIPEPPSTEMRFLDYQTNAAWFYGVAKNRDKVLEFAEKALVAAERFRYPGTASYLLSEPDFDWLRGDKAFTALINRYRN